MNPVRRATPDSEALGSSEDERPWPSSTSFGSLPQKHNGVPGLPGGIWSTQRRGSFKLSEAAHKSAAREVRLGAANPHSALRTANTPSPAASDGTGHGALPFAIPLQPTPKAGRSLSHSQGQREHALGATGSSGARALPLGLLTEEVDTESDSELGGALTHTFSHPPIGSLHRASTYSTSHDPHYSLRNDHDSLEDFAPGEVRRLEAAFAGVTFDQPHRRAQWQSHLGWDDVPNVNESRRHSLADIPTRRGSFAADEPLNIMGCGFSKHRSQHEATGSRQDTADTADMVRFNEDVTGAGFNIPAMYKVPYVEIKSDEMTDDDIRRGHKAALGARQLWGPNTNRSQKRLFVVSFKCSRVEVFYLLDNTGLNIREGDIVIVEADRGQDLGTVQHANVTPDQARLFKRKYSEEQYKWLMMFSSNNAPSNVNPNAQQHGDGGGLAQRNSLLAHAPATMQGLPRENLNSLKSKAIKRLASKHEIKMLSEKEGNEAKAKRTCQQKVAHLQLQMEILDAEWQWDFQKLIFYYYADHYINFKDLITDLYRIYKTRIWLSAVNPASFSQHAQGQPPSGIGPGAITGPSNRRMNNAYTMAYGPDPDPYGAVPPYRIGYDTFTPNYPGIPGIPNSFEQNQAGSAFAPTAQPFRPVTEQTPLPSVQPGQVATGASTDYHFYYDRSGAAEHMNVISPVPKPPMMPPRDMVPPMMPAHLTGSPAYPPFLPSNHSGAFPGAASHAGVWGPRPAEPTTPAYSPWSHGLPTHSHAPGFGRPGTLPLPIGTRPAPSGTAAPTSTTGVGGGTGPTLTGGWGHSAHPEGSSRNLPAGLGLPAPMGLHGGARASGEAANDGQARAEQPLAALVNRAADAHGNNTARER